MTQEEIKDYMNACGEEICREYCPYKDMDHAPGTLCEGIYCEDAVEAFLDENSAFMNNED